MSKPRRQHCFNCGEDLGTFANEFGDILTCGSQECEKAAREEESCALEARREEAEDDRFSRYPGNHR